MSFCSPSTAGFIFYLWESWCVFFFFISIHNMSLLLPCTCSRCQHAFVLCSVLHQCLRSWDEGISWLVYILVPSSEKMSPHCVSGVVVVILDAEWKHNHKAKLTLLMARRRRTKLAFKLFRCWEWQMPFWYSEYLLLNLTYMNELGSCLLRLSHHICLLFIFLYFCHHEPVVFFFFYKTMS